MIIGAGGHGLATAYYLVHSMGSSGGFEEADRKAARNFALAAAKARESQDAAEREAKEKASEEERMRRREGGGPQPDSQLPGKRYRSHAPAARDAMGGAD